MTGRGTWGPARRTRRRAPGTFAAIVGYTPDPNNTGHVLPVWGLTENLDVTVTTLDANNVPKPVTTSFGVHPESGRPTQFVSRAALGGQAGDDTFRFWPDYNLSELATLTRTYNTYYLTDQYLNVTFGYPFSQTYALSSPPDVAVTAVFKDQIVPPVGVASPAGYELDVNWTGQGKEGTWPVDVTLTNTDPYWLNPPQVQKTFQIQFVKGTFGALSRAFGNWDGQDAPYPLTVSPGATSSALPKTPEGDGSRLVLLALRGNRIPAELAADFGYLTNDPSRDTYLDTGTREDFRLSIVDAYGQLVPEGEFSIHSCPRLDHPPGALNACPDRVTRSTGGIATFTINDGTDNRGYMGIALTKAPLNPGIYAVKVESLTQQFRIKQYADMKTADGPEGEYQGGFALCTVQGVEVLDANFTRVPEPQVDDETQFYLRVLETDPAAGSSETISLSIVDNGADDTTPIDVTVARLGATNVFLGPFILAPDASDTPLGATAPTALARTAAIAGPSKKVKAGWRQFAAKKQNKVIGTIPQNTPFQLALRIDTTADGHQPNLLFADGVDATQVTATLVTSNRKPFIAPLPVSLSVGPDQGSIENLTADETSLYSRYEFTYRAPQKPLDLTDPTVYRPIFYATLNFTPSPNLVVALPYQEGGATPKYQWPMYYRGHNFKNMLSDTEFQTPDWYLPNEAAVQGFLENLPPSSLSAAGPSFLKDFYFVNMLTRRPAPRRTRPTRSTDSSMRTETAPTTSASPSTVFSVLTVCPW